MGASTGMESRGAVVDAGDGRLYAWGGASLLFEALLFVLLIVFALAQASFLKELYPSTPLTGTGLENLAQNAVPARVNFAIGLLSDLVLIPGIVALYAALRGIDRGAMRVATLFLGLYVVVDLVVSGVSVLALVVVSQEYAGGSVAVQQSSFAVASYLKDVIDLSLPLGSAILSVGILLTGIVLRRGTWGTATAYLGIGSGIIGLLYGFSAAVPPLTGLQGLSAIGELAWFAVVGWKLLGLSRSARSTERSPGGESPSG